MSSQLSFYIDSLRTLKREYMSCKRIPELELRSIEMGRILTQLAVINKGNCSANEKFEIEEFQLHILYTAMFISKIPLLKEHEVSSEELLARYRLLTNSPEYQELKSRDAKKQKIDRYVVTLENELKQNQRLNVFR